MSGSPDAPGGSLPPPSLARRLGHLLRGVPALGPLALFAGTILVLLQASQFHWFGFSLFSTDWNPNPNDPAIATYGVGYFAVGSGITAAFAVVLAMALSVGLAIALVVYLGGVPARILGLFVDLLAGIPSVVYGIWGYVVLAPYFAHTLEPALIHWLGWLPGFQSSTTETAGGVGLLLAIIILTLMVVPLTTALVRDSLRSLPKDLEESGLALGATRLEVVRRVYLPYARKGMWSAVLLGFGRAVGETVAVFMVIGNEVKLPTSIFSPSSTIATLLVGQFDSAFEYPQLLEALVEIALILFLITFVVNLIGRRLSRVSTISAVPETAFEGD